MNQNKDYDNKINEEELGSLKLKISPRRGLILTGIIFIAVSYTHLTLPTNREV